jgi:putative ABC transport system permease protein
MLLNFLIIAWRNLFRNKVYVIINTLGMGISLACCLSAYLLIAYNVEFNSYFDGKDVENVVKVVHHLKQDGGKEYKELMTPVVMAPFAAQEISGIENYSRYTSLQGAISNGEDVFYETINFADADFFEIFDIGLSQGAYENFKKKNTIFLSENMADKYFLDDVAVGKTMLVNFGDKHYEVVVGGVLNDIPLNTSFTIKALLRMETFLALTETNVDNWGSGNNVSLLLKLSDINQKQDIEKQILRYSKLSNEKRVNDKSLGFELIPFNETISRDEIRQSDLRLPIPNMALIVFSSLGGIILLIACFNLTNTTMALTSRRLKEIGVRKVIGSSRGQIILQFLLEMLFTIFLAVIVSFLLAQVIVPKFAEMWQLQYGLEDLNGTNIIAAMMALLFVSAILAGIYPALFNSKFSPIVLFKGNSGVKGTNPLTHLLLVFQFSLSVIMLCGGIIFIQNMAYQEELDFGYDKENIIKVAVNGQQTYEQLKNAIATNPQIQHIAAATDHIGPYSSHYRPVKIDTTSTNTASYTVSANYFRTLGMQVVEGRDFEEGSYSDMESAIIVDLNFIENHSLTKPFDARIKLDTKEYHIVGVVNNHLSGLKSLTDDEHIYLMAQPENYTSLILYTNKDNRGQVRKYIEEKWDNLFPNEPFQADFQEDLLYQESNGYNVNLKNIFLFLTILGSLLSASGIYALASLNTQRRSKEIAVRKVLGASVVNIIQMINMEFVVILLVALMLGSVASYVVIEELLKSLYAQYMPINILSIAIGGLIILTIGILTTSGTIYKSANANPVDTLKEQ